MAVEFGPKLGLPINAITGEGWDSSLRLLLRALDQLPFLSVLSRALATPPSSPANGDAYIIAASATDDWSGNDNQIAVWTTNNPLSPSGLWEFYHPKEGWLCYSAADVGFYVFQAGAWVAFSAAGISITAIAIEVTSPHPSDPDFDLPHGLGVMPRAVIPVSNGGLIYLQSPFADDTNIKLTTTDPSITGWAFVIR